MRTLLLLFADNVDLNGSVLSALLGVLLGLLHDALGNELLLGDLPQRGGHVVEQDGRGAGPTEPQHHEGHDGAHHHLLVLHLGRRVAEVHHHRYEGEHTKEHVHDDVRERSHEAGGAEDAGARLRDRRENAVEAGVRRHVLNNSEQSAEDRHLNEERQAAHERVDLHLRVDLHHLFLETLGVVSVLLLKLLDSRLHDLHTGRRLDGLGLQWRQQQADDGGEDDDGEAPIAHEAVKPLEHHRQEVNKPIPHVSSVVID